jgi:hypothetical protein
MTKLINLLKEIQTRPKTRIGTGMEGDVYNVGKNKVVKKTGNLDGFTPKELKNYNLFNQHPDIFPHIYKLTKHYVIMDKLDSPGKSIMDVYNFLDDIDPSSRDSMDSMPWREEDFIEKIYESIKNNDFKTFNQILQKAKQLNRTDIYDTLKKCLDFCVKVNEIFKNTLIDMHMNNIGLDDKGQIKIFDL